MCFLGRKNLNNLKGSLEFRPILQIPSAGKKCFNCTKRKDTPQDKGFRPCWSLILGVKQLQIDSAFNI
jgi:hypothetical protein